MPKEDAGGAFRIFSLNGGVMRRQVIFPLVFGVLGTAILLTLGVWQMQRLTWKQTILADIDQRIAAAPVALPVAPDPVADRYLPVKARGVLGETALRVLVSRKQVGAGYRVISAFETGGRRVLLDRGFVSIDTDIPTPPKAMIRVLGNLHWPDERNGSTPANDLARNIWFARDLVQMADVLKAEPVLLVARETSFDDRPITPLPVDSTGISNNHLQYAMTWFLLALAWLAMTGYFLWRMKAPAKGKAT